jgi:hypothetical protein
MNAAAQGDKALSASNQPLAIQHYTQALTELPRAPAYYIARSTAYTRLKPADGGPNPQAALHDAEVGLVLARERGKRELMLSAQMRRAISLYQLGRYGDAEFLLGIVDEKAGTSSAAPEDKSAGLQAAMSGQKKGLFGSELPVWMAKVRRTMRGLPEGDEKAVVSVVEIPEGVRIPTEAELKAQLAAIKSGKGVGAVETAKEDASKAPETSASSVAAGSSAAQPQSATGGAIAPVVAPEKVRHEWYQSQNAVVITLYIKGIPKDSVAVDLKEDSVSHIIITLILDDKLIGSRSLCNSLSHLARNTTLLWIPSTPLSIPLPLRCLLWVPRSKLPYRSKRQVKSGVLWRALPPLPPNWPTVPLRQLHQQPQAQRIPPRPVKEPRIGIRLRLRLPRKSPRGNRLLESMRARMMSSVAMQSMDSSRSFTPMRILKPAAP